ncbi:unnamed protein product [Cladocopium goreaui]|uniref:Copia protein (Gag-int-pol protein) [Cleaved into: Copia VLP protein Copia protease ] n=1 Tax=Cladocopium goreaui TaxID=2562237 RepID=A0A9P1FWG9_9DINO|nr:unnamed protein product [Cladocopium goreaui]
MNSNGNRRSSSVPPNPFWSQDAQMEHTLQTLRPLDLDARNTPVPNDHDLDSSPRPLQQLPSGEQGQGGVEQVASFETPGSMRGNGGHDGEEAEVETKDGERGLETVPCLDGRDGTTTRAWKRRAQSSVANGEMKHEENGASESHEKKLEDDLGEQVLLHFQQETVRLQNQNQLLVMEIQRMKEERENQQRLAVPSSWNGDVKTTAMSPPRKTPVTNESHAWMSPQTFRCTPNGTRVPSGPPPPDPPPLPAWPPELGNYEIAVEPPRKLRGVMGDAGYRVREGACSPRSARHFWLEQEVASLKERLEHEASRNRSFQGAYWSKPFQTEREKAFENHEAVSCMRRNAGLDSAGMGIGVHAHGEQVHRDRASIACEFGAERLQDRASLEQAHGDPRLGVRAHFEHVLGDQRLGDRAPLEQALGDQCLPDRAGSMESMHGAVPQAVQAGATPGQGLGDVFQPARACNTPGQGLGDVFQPVRARNTPGQGLGDLSQQALDGGLLHNRALRHEREVVEDGDLKSVPIQLPSLPAPEGRDASLEAGDWLIQLEPLIGDLSKHAASWWRRVMESTTTTYGRWLHADPLSRLKITAPENGSLSAGFERLDQRVTSLLLQSVPKAIKDEIIATRELSTTAILFRVMRTYQPGGLLEKSRLLEDLTTTPVTKTSQDVVAALRLWKRKASRASELCAQLPDPLLLIRTLDGIAKPVVESSSQANFRIATFRMNYSLDIRPSLANVWLFYDLLLAEAEVAVHSTSTASTSEAKNSTKAAVKIMQGSTTTKTTTAGTTTWPCKFWLSDGGCRQGQRCRWPHPWEGVSDRSLRCSNCSSNQHLQAECPYKAQVKPPVGGEGDENGGGKNPDKGKGKGKNKGKTKTEAQKGNKENTSQTDGKKEDGVKTAGSIVEEDVKKNDAATASGGGSVSNGKKPDGGGNSNNTNELLQEATKLLKSLHLPSAKMIMLQEIGDPQQGPADLMLLDSGATHALRRAKTWSEWDDAEHTVVALAQGTTTSLRIKHGTETLLFTPDDGSFGNGILPMGALTKLGYEITWTGGDCRMKNGHGENVEVTVVNGCPMINRRFGMQLIDQLENESRLTRARSALVRALIQQPTLLKNLPDLDSETLLMVFMKKEFPDLPDTVCRKVVRRSLEIDSEQLPWNRWMRRRMLRAQRVILHLYSGKDQKTWLQLEDANTMVVCLDRAINPKMDMLNDHVMMFLMKIAVSGKLHAIFGGPPCRTVSACRYADDKGPKPVRSEEEPFGLSTLTPQQREWVEDDVTMMFRMKLLYMTAEHHKPAWCNKVLFAMEQPQDPCEYRSQQDVNKYKFMSVWRTTAWKHFQEKYELVITSFEQGAYGHVKPKPTSFGHNITGFEQLHGAKTQREPGHQDTWRHQSLPQRIAESATWSEWAPGVKAALLEGLRRNLSQLNDGRCHLGALGSAEEAPRDSNGDDVKPKECGAQLCPLSEVLVKRKSWNERYAAWRWERAPGRVMGPDPWSSLTSGGYCVQLEDGKFLASTDVVVENEELGNHADVDIVVQERFHAARDQHLAEAPRRRLRYKQGVPQVAKIELGSNSGEHGWSKYEQQHGQQGDDLEEKRLLCMHKEISTVLSEECVLMDDMDVEQASCIPSLSMLAHQKFDVELQLRALDLEKKHMAEEENFLVTKTVTAEQVYNEWNDWKEAMMSEYRSIVEEKRAVRQVSRGEAQQWACDGGVKYEELPSKVVFTRKMGGKRKVRACICGNFEDEVATATYAGGCDASQIRCVARHAALKRWAIFTTDIKCAFLNAERKDRSKLIAMTIPSIYVKLGVATSQDVWLVDAAMYGLVSSPRDWADHRDQVIPTMTWLREEAGRRWKGSFQRAADQHLWHLSERCQETGEEKDRGIMTVYVDDVLLAADEKTAQCALQAIAAVWECAPAERATLQSSVSFCGFEIQQNEDLHGGGFRLHQHSYEEELAKKWNVTEVRRQLDFKLPTPEEEAEVQRSEDAELVKKAQACTGALLWLATRTRPEISVGVAAMSRLCTKMPELTISIGNKIIAYLQRPTLGLIYAATVGPVHGARDQLDLPRCERTVEAFSDISYASTKGYRSVQGQVYFYAGAPVMWNTNRQPFPTQSTAESELVGLCEALVGGRATASLVAAVRKESEEVLIKRLWGDNAAAISLATGEGQGSWRTRHLRIRAAILRSALWQNEWHLGHLKGRELVADSFTKIVDGASFERALQDLCVVADAKKSKSEIIGGSDKASAKIAMLVGATMLSGAAATEEDEENEEQSWFWTIGLILMSVGAVYIFSTIVRSGIWLHNRLLGSSGSYDGDGIKGQAEPPRLRMLQHSSGEETAERRGRINQQRATYASPVNMSEIQEMVAQSLAAQHDPHNKMHGRDVANWSSSEDDHKPQRPVKLHTSDQLPKRRKKKGKGGRAKQDDDFDEAAIERSWQSMLGTTRNLFAASTLTSGPQSGYSSAAKGSSSKGMGSRAGSNRAEVEQTASSSSSQQVSSRSGLSIAGQSGQSGDAGQSGAASAAAGSISSSSRTRSGTSSAAAAEHERGSSVSHQNSWNEFQKSYSGRGWGSDRMRAEYWHYRATGKKPL